MKNHNRPFLCGSLLALLSVGGLSAVVEAAQPPAAKAARWSDRTTWPDRKVPKAGDSVTIPAGKSVVLDVSPP
ncbi:MAG: hypothetical protein EOP08_14955, partial [Proteobacteria bacterium]